MDPSAMTYTQARRTRTRKPGTPGDRFATALRWLRWPVVVAWILALVLLHGLSSSLSNLTDDGASAYLGTARHRLDPRRYRLPRRSSASVPR